MCGIFAYCNYLKDKVSPRSRLIARSHLSIAVCLRRALVVCRATIYGSHDLASVSHRDISRIAKNSLRSFATDLPVKNIAVMTRPVWVSMGINQVKSSISRRLARWQGCVSASPSQTSIPPRSSRRRSPLPTHVGQHTGLPRRSIVTLSALDRATSLLLSTTASLPMPLPSERFCRDVASSSNLTLIPRPSPSSPNMSGTHSPTSASRSLHWSRLS